jgi:DNA-binding NtrC family response regulator
MSPIASKSARIAVFGLDDKLVSELTTLLDQLGQTYRKFQKTEDADCLRIIDLLDPDLIFYAAENGDLTPILSAGQQMRPALPVVVVSRHADVPHWLDALEAGAADYCAAPFDRREIEWILETKMRHVGEMAITAAVGA